MATLTLMRYLMRDLMKMVNRLMRSTASCSLFASLSSCDCCKLSAPKLLSSSAKNRFNTCNTHTLALNSQCETRTLVGVDARLRGFSGVSACLRHNVLSFLFLSHSFYLAPLKFFASDPLKVQPKTEVTSGSEQRKRHSPRGCR